MGGVQWSETEKMLLLFFDICGNQHEQMRQKLLQKVGTNRTVVAIRSKLSELREDNTLYSPEERAWVVTAVQQRIQQLPEENQHLFVSDM